MNEPLKLKDCFPYWSEQMQLLAEMVVPLTEAELTWVPEGGRNSIGWLARHIISVTDRDIGEALLGSPLVGESRDLVTGQQLAVTIGLQAALVDDFLVRYPASLLREKRVFRGRERPVYEFLWNTITELLHHRGQVMMILRMMGKEPPSI